MTEASQGLHHLVPAGSLTIHLYHALTIQFVLLFNTQNSTLSKLLSQTDIQLSHCH